MKTLIKLTSLIILSTLLKNQVAFAQEESIDTVFFFRQDSVMMEISYRKFLLNNFSNNDPCYREGLGIMSFTKVDSVGIASPEFYEKLPIDTSEKRYGKMDGDKNIYWIHGLGGNTSTWNLPAMASQYGNSEVNFPAYKVNSQNFGTYGSTQSYSEDFGITVAAQNYANNARGIQDKHTEFDFIIAHSQGGIVAREWLRKMEKEPNAYEYYAHGLVTFGTPHTGAKVINNTRKEMGNKLEPFLKDACISLSKPALIDKINESFITRLVIKDDAINSILNSSCSGLSGFVVPIVLDKFQKRTTKDYAVGSSFLEG
ncbi:MAG: hypothetical protein WC760_11205 [Bacteroidia bacterium]|jgi:hypothetical protein